MHIFIIFFFNSNLREEEKNNLKSLFPELIGPEIRNYLWGVILSRGEARRGRLVFRGNIFAIEKFLK